MCESTFFSAFAFLKVNAVFRCLEKTAGYSFKAVKNSFNILQVDIHRFLFGRVSKKR